MRTTEPRSVWFLLTITALLSVPIAALEVSFHLREGQEVVADGTVCFFEAESPSNPFGHFFASADPRCMPAGQNVDVPVGHWNFYATRDATTSAHPALLQVGYGRPVEGKSLIIDLVPAGVLLIAPQQKTSRAFAYIPPDVAMSANSRPFQRGEEGILVPGSRPIVPIIVEGGVPTRIGELVTIEPGEKRPAQFLPMPAETGAAVVWISMDVPPTVPVPEPKVVLTDGNGREREPITPAVISRTAHLSLVIFKDVPTGAAVVRVHGDLWEPASILMNIERGRVSVGTEPLRLAAAGTIMVDWALPDERWYAPAAASRGCDDSDPSNEEPVAPQLRLLNCNGDECDVIATRQLDGDNGAARFTQIPVGTYVAELAAPDIPPLRRTVFARPGIESRTELHLEPLVIYGSVRREEAPLRSRVQIGTAVAMTDHEGRFGILLSKASESITVTPCGAKDSFTMAREEPFRHNEFISVTVPAVDLRAAVVDARTRIPLENANVQVVARGRSPGEVSGEMLRWDPRMRLYVRTYYSPAGAKVCAQAPSYADRCVTISGAPNDDVWIELTPQAGTKGRIHSQRQLLDPRLYILDAGVILPITVAADGSFETAVPVTALATYVLTARNQPLARLHPSLEGGVLILRTPADIVRTFVVKAPQLKGYGRLEVSVGGWWIPPEILDTHQLLHRSSGVVSADGALVPEIQQQGDILVRVTPFTDRSIPPVLEGQLAADTDLLIVR